MSAIHKKEKDHMKYEFPEIIEKRIMKIKKIKELNKNKKSIKSFNEEYEKRRIDNYVFRKEDK